MSFFAGSGATILGNDLLQDDLFLDRRSGAGRQDRPGAWRRSP
jgi:hypothetical protein